jgi:hypothetical protein
MTFASLADLVKNYESSGGDYTAVNRQSGAGGAYQFVPTTWKQYAGQIGVNTSQYPTAQSAPPQVQDAVFQQAVSQRGLGDWTCPGCNSPLTQYVAANDVSGLPVMEGYGSNGVTTTTGPDGIPTVDVTPSGGNNPPATTSGGGTGSGQTGLGVGAEIGYTPPASTGGPSTVGLAPGVASQINTIASNAINTVTGGLTGWFDSIENWVGRGFLILIAVVVLLVALWRIMDPSGEKTRAVVRDAAVAA